MEGRIVLALYGNFSTILTRILRLDCIGQAGVVESCLVIVEDNLILAVQLSQKNKRTLRMLPSHPHELQRDNNWTIIMIMIGNISTREGECCVLSYLESFSG